jgi:hypothetical protein
VSHTHPADVPIGSSTHDIRIIVSARVSDHGHQPDNCHLVDDRVRLPDLGLVHAMVWMQRKRATAHMLLALTALGTAWLAACELLMMRVESAGLTFVQYPFAR